MDKQLQKMIKTLSFCALAALAPLAAGAQSYCTAGSGSCGTDHINNFSTTGGVLNITNNSTGCSGGGYNYYSSMKVSQVAGLSVNFSITVVSFTQYAAIYVDYNQNGSFTDAGEQVYTSGTSKISSTSGSFTIPITATPGTTRMRVVADYTTSNPNSCGSRTWGEIEDYNFEILSPCTAIGTVSNSDVYAKSARISWTPVTGSAGYEYFVSTSSTAPTVAGTPTTATSVNITGLTPATNYCVWARNKCNATSFSQWKSTCFTTSNCTAPAITFANITHNSALAVWNSSNIATQYEYIYTTDPTTPGSSATGTITTQSNFTMQNLLPETNYYVHIRMYCVGNDLSGWDTYQFTTMKECMAPAVNIVKTSANDMEISWDPVETAVAYEYALNSMPTPPSLGTTVYNNSMTVNLPADKKAYYFHIRSKCISIFNASEWSTELLREADPTAINNVNSEVLVQAYPNPVNDVITIQIDGVKQVKGTVTITDVAGKHISTTQITQAKTNVSMGGLTAGVYFIRYSNDTHSQVFRINKL